MLAKHRPRRVRMTRRGRRGVALVAVSSAALWAPTAVAAPALSPSGLKVNALVEPLGIGDGTPDLSWKLSGHGPRRRPDGVRGPRRRVARRSSPAGRTCGSRARSARTRHRTSSTAVLRCRCGSPPRGRYACGMAPARPRRGASPRASRSASWNQSDWGSSRWIELAGRTNAQPLPIFARGFSLDKARSAAPACT